MAYENNKTSMAVSEAFQNAALFYLGDDNYKDIIINQRVDGPLNYNSAYDLSAEDIERAILEAHWEEKETINQDDTPITFYETSDIPYGRTTVLDIRSMSDDTTFYAMDPEHTGKIDIGAAYIPKAPEEKTCIAVGMTYINSDEKPMVIAFWPGERRDPFTVDVNDKIYDGLKLTKEQVLNLGFDKAKFMSPDLIKKYERGYMFEKTASSKNEKDRISVARDNKCSISILNMLSKDESPEVRMAVAKNEGTPAFILLNMLNDKEPTGLSDNLICDYAKSGLVRMAGDDLRHLPMGVIDIENIAKSKNSYLKDIIANNEIAPLHILERLSKDPNMNIVTDSIKTLQELVSRTDVINEETIESIKSIIKYASEREGGIDPKSAAMAARMQKSSEGIDIGNEKREKQDIAK